MNAKRRLVIILGAITVGLQLRSAHASENDVRLPAKIVVEGGSMWVADLIPDYQRSADPGIRVQCAALDQTGNVQSYQLVEAGGCLRQDCSHRESYPMRWDIGYGDFVAIVPLEFPPVQWSFPLCRMPLSDVRLFPRGKITAALAALGKPVMARWNDQKVRVEPLHLIGDWVRMNQRGIGVHFDLCALPDAGIVLYLLVGDRMTAWYYPAGPSKGQIRGAHLIDGPLLLNEDEWMRVATFVPGFTGPFRVCVRGQTVYFVTADGKAYVCEGFRTPIQRPTSPDPLIQATYGKHGRSIPFGEGFLKRVLGAPEERIVAQPVVDVGAIEAVVLDRSLDDILWVTRDSIRSSSLDEVYRRSGTTPPPVEGLTGPMVEARKYLLDVLAFRSQAEPEQKE